MSDIVYTEFEYTEMSRVASTALDLVAHNAKRGDMYVRFKNGSERIYSGIDVGMYDDLVYAESPGRYYNREIYGKYTSTPASNIHLVLGRWATPSIPDPVDEFATSGRFEVKYQIEGTNVITSFTTEAESSLEALDTFKEKATGLGIRFKALSVKWYLD